MSVKLNEIMIFFFFDYYRENFIIENKIRIKKYRC